MSVPASTRSLEFKPDLEQATQHWLAFWEQELIDRPCCVMTAPKEGVEPVPGPRYMAGATGEFGPVIDQVLAHAATIWWGGDAVPSYTPSFGPDMMSAWLGSELVLAQDEGTSWALPFIDDWPEALPIELEPGGYWWRRMLDFCEALGKALRGKMLVAHLDLHGNMDALLAMRGGGPLCLDLMDIPETIDAAMASVRAMHVPIYEGLYNAANMGEFGTCGWVPAYHPVRTNTIQCDFAALIGPHHFRRWALPALEEEAAYLEHCVYHYDGPECLVHLDDICSVKGLDCIQWTTGARNKPFIEWMDLLKEIQSKGCSVWVPCNTEDIRIYHRELDPSMVFYTCSAPTQTAGEETLKWLVDNT